MHHQAGANCIIDAKLYFWTIFQFFFYPNGTWTHPPTSKLFLDFWNFFNFAKPLNVLRRLSSLLDQESRMAIFRAFIVSNFNYCPLVWHFCGKTNTSKIEKLQERALRFVFNNFTSSYDNMLEKAELTTLTLSRIKTLALEVYKAIHGHSPPYMNDMFTSRQEQTHSLRNAHQLNIPCTRTVGFGSHSIQFEGARLWNHLPNKIRCAENLASFKKLLRTWGGCHCAMCTSYF